MTNRRFIRHRRVLGQRRAEMLFSSGLRARIGLRCAVVAVLDTVMTTRYRSIDAVARGDRVEVLRERNGLCGKAWPPSAATCESILKGDPCRLRAFAMGYAGLDKVTQQQEEEQQEEEQEHRATQLQEEERAPIRLWQAMSIRREFGEPPIIRDARPTMPAVVLPCTSTPRSAQAARLEWAWRTRSRAGHPRSAGARCSSTRWADLGCGT